MVIEAHKLDRFDLTETHTVIVGSGSGGGVAAFYAAAEGNDTVVLEEGGYFEASDMTQREEQMYPALYRSGGAQTTVDGLVNVMQGSAFGGSTLINTADCTPIEPEVVDHWRRHHGVDIDPAELKKSYDNMVRVMNIHRLEDEIVNRNNSILNVAADKRGWKNGVFNSNRRGCIGSSYCLVGCAYDAKQGTHLTWLPMAEEKGARIFTDMRVDHLERLADGYKVHGHIVEKISRKKLRRFSIKAKRVILSAGAVHSPAILKKSGFDKVLPQLGKNVSLQPQWAAVSLFDEAEEFIHWRGSPQSSFVTEFHHNHEDYGLGGFALEAIGGVIANIAMQLPGLGMEHKEWMARSRSMQVSMVLVPDQPVGSMEWSWREDGMVMPSIHYTPTEEWITRARDGLRTLVTLMIEEGAQEVLLPHQMAKPIRTLNDIEQVDHLPIESGLTSFISAHVQGSCRMGESSKTSVVDRDSRVHGHDDLYVMDASVHPTSASSHTMIPVLTMTDMVMRRLTNFKG